MSHLRGREPFANVQEVAQALRPSYPVLCVYRNRLEQAARRFARLFPGKVLYAVKCNPHPMILDALHAGGIRNFDTASLAEIAAVAEKWDDVEAFFMHPVKARPVIATARKVHGVRVFALDHRDELRKICDQLGKDRDDVVAAVRVKTADAGTLFHLSEKFGAGVEEAAELLREVEREGLRPGLSFHVGSQCLLPQAYRDALDLLGEIIAASGVGPVFIDVGGGFPAPYLGTEMRPLEDFMAAIREGLHALKLPSTCEIAAEPGRALVAEGCSLLTQVQLRKDDRLYINDGIYGSLSEMVAAGVRLPSRLIRLEGREPSSETMIYTAAGPTCDSLDMIPAAFRLPVDVREGDWIEVARLGAYSYALATRFNGFHADTFVEVSDSEEFSC